jgi:hypothetical protein
MPACSGKGAGLRRHHGTAAPVCPSLGKRLARFLRHRVGAALEADLAGLAVEDIRRSPTPRHAGRAGCRPAYFGHSCSGCRKMGF